MKSSNTTGRCLWLAGATVLLFMSASTWAHHSFGMFDMTRSVTVRGTVRVLQWTNPHCFLQLLVPPGPVGEPVEWSIEMAAPLQLYRRGMRPTSVRPGDRVTVVIHPVKLGSKGGSFVALVDVNGKRFGEAAK